MRWTLKKLELVVLTQPEGEADKEIRIHVRLKDLAYPDEILGLIACQLEDEEP